MKKKPLAAPLLRLQRVLLRLQKYDLRVVHVRDKDIPVVDTLSRTVMKKFPIIDMKTKQLQDASSVDQHMQRISGYF